METKLFDIIAIVNSGFSEEVMAIAKEKGARGGTILQANGSVSDEASKLYGVGVNPEKEIVMILVQENLVDPILKDLYTKLGNNTEATGIFFTLPVTHASENLIKQYQKKAENED